jgi:hypothetical protein
LEKLGGVVVVVVVDDDDNDEEAAAAAAAAAARTLASISTKVFLFIFGTGVFGLTNIALDASWTECRYNISYTVNWNEDCDGTKASNIES